MQNVIWKGGMGGKGEAHSCVVRQVFTEYWGLRNAFTLCVEVD